MRLCCVLAMLLVCYSKSSADDTEPPQPAGIPRAMLKARVVDPEGTPIAGARVVPWALRSIVGHGLWRQEEHGPVPLVDSGEDGRLSLTYPLFHEREAKSRVTDVSVNVSHPEFCRAVSDLSVESNADSVIRLERGTKLSIAATKTGEESLLRDSWLLRSDDWSPESQSQAANGRIDTEPLPDKDRWLYVVHLPVSGPALFSEPYEWNPKDKESLQADLEVAPGSKLTGQLSANVPRPVQHGRVLFQCVALGLQENPWTVWASSSAIQPDGTFVIDEIPPGCDVQLLALCDGFVSKRPDTDELSRLKERYGNVPGSMVFSLPAVLFAEDFPMTIELGMVATASLTLRVLDEDQQPLPGAKIFISPNQYWPGVGSQMLGDIPDSARLLRTKAWGASPAMRIFEVQSNAEGVAHIHEIPPGYSTLDVVFPDGQTQEYDFEPGQELTITAKPRRQ